MRWTAIRAVLSRLALVAGLGLSACKAPPSVWDIITRLGEKAPLRKATVQDVLPVAFELEARTEHASRWAGGALDLADGARVSAIHLLLDHDDRFDATSALSLDIEGTCLTLSDVRSRYPELDLTDVPHGHSWEEQTLWTSTQAWGRVSFGFKAKNPDCLFSVTMRPPSRP